MELNFENIIHENHPMIYKICRVYSSEDDFDDLYQEVLISIWKAMKSFKGEAKLSTWLYRVVLNTALTYSRNKKRRWSRLSFVQLKESHEATESPKADDKIEHLYAAIKQLAKDERALILLYLDDKKYQEIADISGLSVSNVGVKINRLKKKLYELLNTAT
jgi:RNA polymerase sigma-70 factor (ECF subfamily)